MAPLAVWMALLVLAPVRAGLLNFMVCLSFVITSASAETFSYSADPAREEAWRLFVSGPFDLTLKRLEKCPDQGTRQLLFQTRIKKLNRYQYVYSSPWTLPYKTDERLGIAITVYKWGRAGWANTGYTFNEKDACATAQKMVPHTFESVMKAVRWDKGCPLPAGNYTVDGWVLDLKLELDKLPYGEYRLDGAVMRDKTTRLGCVRVFIDVTQKVT